MSGAAVAALCISFALVVFLYFTVWTFVLPFVDSANSLQAYFPPRSWLIILPFSGVGGLGLVVFAFVQYCSFIARRDQLGR